MNFLKNMLFFIFPRKCEMCEKISESYICDKCKNEIEKSKLYLNKVDHYSKDDTKYFDEHAYVFEYNSIIREKIIEYKFKNKPYLGKMFSEFFVKNEKMCGFFKKYDIIIPVPIHNKRKKERGYNQTALIVNDIAKKTLELEYYDALVKVKNIVPQSTLRKEERKENSKNVYKLKADSERIIENKKVLIFDDIYTTGATAEECAKAVKKAKPDKIGILTLAKD